MKRILAIVLTIIMVVSLCACGKEKAEKYCFNCGEGISKSVSFCEHCGANVKENSVQNSSDNTSITSTPSTNITSSSKPAETKPSISAHTHSYSKKVTAATCSEKGYTTYTCSCGDTYKDNYTNTKPHRYSSYACAMCGAIDKSNPYGYLVAWLKSNAIETDAILEYCYDKKNNSSDKYFLRFSIHDEYLSIERTQELPSGDVIWTRIGLTSFSYLYDCIEGRVVGTINASTYNDSTPLTSDFSYSYEISGDRVNHIRQPMPQLLPIAKASIDTTLSSLKLFFKNNDFPITLADLGYKVF